MKFNDMDKLSNLFSQGYIIESIGDIYFSNYDENTRFVILEKHPEKIKWETMDGNDSVKTSIMTVNLNLIKPAQFIELDIKINKSDIKD